MIQVHKELQDTIAQLEAIRHEIRTISFVNPGPLNRRLVENGGKITDTNGLTNLNIFKSGISIYDFIQWSLTW